MLDTTAKLLRARQALEEGRLRSAGRLLRQAVFQTVDTGELAQVHALTVEGLARCRHWWQRGWFPVHTAGARLEHFSCLAEEREDELERRESAA